MRGLQFLPRGRRLGFLGWLALGASLVGAGLVLFDPGRGASRRAMLRDKTAATVRRVDQRARGWLLDARQRARGAFHELQARFNETAVSDEVLEKRVRAEIGRAVSRPGALRVNAQDRCVEISGPVLAEEADALVESIGAVHGVKDVVDRLEIHEEAGNQPEFQGSDRELGPDR